VFHLLLMSLELYLDYSVVVIAATILTLAGVWLWDSLQRRTTRTRS
jgi:hypothetical protein